MTPRRVQVTKKTALAGNHIYVGRGRNALYGNPFVSNDNRLAAECFARWMQCDIPALCFPRPVGVMLAKPWLSSPAFNEYGFPIQSVIRAHLETLQGRNLGCWCRKSDFCHADVLIALANGLPLPDFAPPIAKGPDQMALDL